MNNKTYRINGGIGFSIDTPTTDSFFTLSNNIEINDNRDKKFTMDELCRLHKLLENIKNENKLKYGISCVIESDILPHYGLGSTTSIYLSCIEALFLMNDISCDNSKIIALSKRGGTSGIGINTYFDGGFIFDVGIKNETDSLEPSSIADRKSRTPLVLNKSKTPNWNIGICIPYYLKGKSEQEEINFFKESCPIEKMYIGDILYESIYGVTSAIVENDYNSFCNSINEIQLTKWKYLERSLYGQGIIELEAKIKQLDADCVGMSSLGPLLFFTSKNINNIINILKNDIKEIRCYNSTMNNQGRIITYA
jgi:beta-ribofuranosylaminobenzene 5'-phosphate synthase